MVLFLARNSFFGNISHLCEVLSISNSLIYLDLSSNNLSGEIPNCWKYGHNLAALNLADNNLLGEVPLSLKNCIDLTILQLAKNRLLGNVLVWISENLQKLEFLSLSFNSFSGNIPMQLCQLKYLNHLDLSHNNLYHASFLA